MVFEAGATPAPAAPTTAAAADGDAAKTPEQEAQAKKQVATATSFLQQLDSLESSKAVTFNDKIKANLIKLTEKAKKKGGDAGDDKDPAPALVKLAVIKAAKSEMKNQCGLQAKSPMCASLPKDQACAFICPQDIKELTSKNANSACAFNALFGAPASSNGLKWSSTCKPDYLTDADFAKKQEEKQAVPEGAPAVVAGQKNNEENFPSLPAGSKKTKAAEAGPQGAWKNGPPKAEKKKKDKKKQGEAAEKKPAAVVAGEKVTEENYPSLPGGKKAKAAEPQGAWKKGPPKP